MSSFRVYGLDRLEADLNSLAQLSEDDLWPMLERGAEVIRQAHQTYLDAWHKITGQLEASITLAQKRRGEELVAVVAPKGKRKGAFTGKRKKKDSQGRRRSSGSYAGTNAEVAYFLEYGTPRMEATHWMETANDEAAPRAQDAMEQAWDDFLTKKGF